MKNEKKIQNIGEFLLTVIELILVLCVVYFDALIPTLVILFIALISMLIRREKISSLGFRKPENTPRMFFQVFLLTVGWTIIDFCLFLPVLNHLTGTTRNVEAFGELQGNIGQVLLMLGASWTLAAFGEEIAYRGFIQAKIRCLCKNDKIGIVLAVLSSSILFCLAHREQDIVGVAITFIDSLFFSFLLYRYKSIWASILAHGLLNTIGIVTFFFTGPLYGLW